jgi:carboxyl-terminal processing protease
MLMKTNAKRRILDNLAQGTLLGLLLALVFFAGYIVRGHLTVTAEEDTTNDSSFINEAMGFLRGQETQTANTFKLLNEVKGLLEEHYVRNIPDAKQMEYAAIRGYLGELGDPYTFFHDPPDAQSESDVLAGQYGGIGVQAQRNPDGLLTLYPFPDGPAAQVGIQNGDVLLAVNGQELAPDETMVNVDRMLRGEVGGGRGVEVTVQAPDAGDTRQYFIEFAVVRVPSVVWRAVIEEPTLGYVQVIRFTSRTPDELRLALDELYAQAVTGLILDVRGNSGGLLQESIEVASEFLDGGVVLYEIERGKETVLKADPGGQGLGKPLVVLVDQRTASAAEVVAGAIQDRGRGILIGQKTFGKGSVQLIFRLSDGSSIHITAAEWLTPARRPLAGNGLEPDIRMIPVDDGRDVELGEAIRYLRQATE